jgi:ABC-2 type transport system permease protein
MLVKSEMEYKASFILTMIGSMISTFTSILSMLFLIHKFGEVAGWTMNEVILITGVALFGHSFTEIVFQGLNHLYMKVKSGILDQMMVRPRGMLFQVICSDFELNKIGRLTESIILLVYGIINVNIEWNLYKVLVFLLILVGVNVLFAALLLLKATLCFWTVDGIELMNILQEGGRDLSSYPICIYKEWFKNFFTFIVPFGMVNYFPMVYLLGKEDVSFWNGLTPLLTIPFFLVILLVWKIGLRSYQSTGS